MYFCVKFSRYDNTVCSSKHLFLLRIRGVQYDATS
jgi:hypothetical protein